MQSHTGGMAQSRGNNNTLARVTVMCHANYGNPSLISTIQEFRPDLLIHRKSAAMPIALGPQNVLLGTPKSDFFSTNLSHRY